MGGPSVTSPNIITPLILPVLSWKSWWWQWCSWWNLETNFFWISLRRLHPQISICYFKDNADIEYRENRILYETLHPNHQDLWRIFQSILTSSQSIFISRFTDEIGEIEYLHRMKRFHSKFGSLATLSNWTGLIAFLNFTFAFAYIIETMIKSKSWGGCLVCLTMIMIARQPNEPNYSVAPNSASASRFLPRPCVLPCLCAILCGAIFHVWAVAWWAGIWTPCLSVWTTMTTWGCHG